jgi:hypothetical protein
MRYISIRIFKDYIFRVGLRDYLMVFFIALACRHPARRADSDPYRVAREIQDQRGYFRVV